ATSEATRNREARLGDSLLTPRNATSRESDNPIVSHLPSGRTRCDSRHYTLTENRSVRLSSYFQWHFKEHFQLLVGHSKHNNYAVETPRPDSPFCSDSMSALSRGMQMVTVVPARSDLISSDPLNSRMRSRIPA